MATRKIAAKKKPAPPAVKLPRASRAAKAPRAAKATTEGLLQTGGNGTDGTLQLLDKENKVRLHVEPGLGHLTRIFSASGKCVAELSALGELVAVLTIGGGGANGVIYVKDANSKDRVKIFGEDGDIQLFGADAAELFPLRDQKTIPQAGTVMIMSDDGRVKPSCEPYDRRVVGIISGAADYRPGLTLGLGRTEETSVPIALAGCVSCLADASNTPIRAGDLLTTSAIPGFAMVATNVEQATGTIIGKALRDLPEGQGLVPTLVMLR